VIIINTNIKLPEPKIMIEKVEYLPLKYMRMKSLYLGDGYPIEDFKIIDFEDIKPNKYYISSYGRIFTITGEEMYPREELNLNNNIIYYRIALQCTGIIKERKFFMHRLVANAFIPKIEQDILLGRDIVNHKYNMDGRCNFYWNLEWSTIQENTIHAFNNISDDNIGCQLLIRREPLTNIGETNGKARISEFQADLICKALFIGNYTAEEAAKYAGLPGDKRDTYLVYAIKGGYVWNEVSSKYGVIPREQTRYPKKRYR